MLYIVDSDKGHQEDNQRWQQIQKPIRLVGLTSVYINPGLRLVDLAVLVYLRLTQRGSLTLKVNVKIFQHLTTF